ncbi:hypothetical protein H6G52_00890 [Limnothrix sp. FACHB-881]|uniref:hypothetical protein n=1 Tax=unclassified Limnothrix TaxID=2632864 RepID=UPI0016813523|nr:MULTISPECIES: hypothetical protein [unclassified Limnothrix]MBD2160596.1 hypothetical protein [Limnothrix sp. FACHB-1083]MBD2191298.1 hypothetical protein [Limnothrix sp. FACHB-1088]MBD2633903.1 hypothetical protein [Limnothrix sp. FACHB-881]
MNQKPLLCALQYRSDWESRTQTTGGDRPGLLWPGRSIAPVPSGFPEPPHPNAVRGRPTQAYVNNRVNRVCPLPIALGIQVNS